MDTLPSLSVDNQELLKIMAELINLSKDQLASRPIHKNKLNPKQTLLVSMFAAVNSYTEAIFELCKQSRPAAASVILRSVVEAWINCLYILGHPNNRHLWLFAIEDSYYRKSIVQSTQEFYQRYPKQRGKLFSRKKLREMYEIPTKELENYKQNLNITFNKKEDFDREWKSLIDRAISVDKRLGKKQKNKAGGVEHTYLMAYKHLSEYTHLSMRGVQHFWLSDNNGDTLILDKNPLGIDLVLSSSYVFYLYFVSKLKQYDLIKCSINKYKRFYEDVLSKRQK